MTTTQGPKQYSIYQQEKKADGTTEWHGIHRLPVRAALRHAQEIRERGYRVIWRLDGEYGPRFKD